MIWKAPLTSLNFCQHQRCQDKRTYWCWDTNEEVNRDTRANSTTTRGVGNLDGRTAAGLMWDTQLVGRKQLSAMFFFI